MSSHRHGFPSNVGIIVSAKERGGSLVFPLLQLPRRRLVEVQRDDGIKQPQQLARSLAEFLPRQGQYQQRLRIVFDEIW